jgi:peptidoglycan/LPS O-acetylase OafA/YrhL
MSQKFSVINGLRGIAILAVIYHHVWGKPPGYAAVHALGHTFFPLAPLSNGFEGVAVFFVLSGFVLHWPYASGRRKIATLSDALAFYKRRAARLLPLLLLCIAVTTVITDAGFTARFWPDALKLAKQSLLPVSDPFFPEGNWVLWTIRIELWFSLLLPALSYLFVKGRIMSTFAIMACFALMVRFLNFIPLTHVGATMVDSLAGRIDDFLAGMVLAAIYARNPRRFRHKGYLWLGLSAVLAAFMMNNYAGVGLLTSYASPFQRPLLWLGIMLVAGHLLSHERGLAARLMSARPLQMTGLMCYSLYCWHVPLMNWLRPQEHPELLPEFIILVAGFSFLTYRFIEFAHVQDIRSLLPQKPVLDTVAVSS